MCGCVVIDLNACGCVMIDLFNVCGRVVIDLNVGVRPRAVVIDF